MMSAATRGLWCNLLLKNEEPSSLGSNILDDVIQVFDILNIVLRTPSD